MKSNQKHAGKSRGQSSARHGEFSAAEAPCSGARPAGMPPESPLTTGLPSTSPLSRSSTAGPPSQQERLVQVEMKTAPEGQPGHPEAPRASTPARSSWGRLQAVGGAGGRAPALRDPPAHPPQPRATPPWEGDKGGRGGHSPYLRLGRLPVSPPGTCGPGAEGAEAPGAAARQPHPCPPTAPSHTLLPLPEMLLLVPVTTTGSDAASRAEASLTGLPRRGRHPQHRAMQGAAHCL